MLEWTSFERHRVTLRKRRDWLAGGIADKMRDKLCRRAKRRDRIVKPKVKKNRRLGTEIADLFRGIGLKPHERIREIQVKIRKGRNQIPW
jgi:hypothetical protein